MWPEEDNSDNEFDDDDVEEIDKYFKPTFVVIAIDTHPLMFSENEDKSTPFKDCLSACYSVADSLLLNTGKRSWNQFAVVVANEENPYLTKFSDNLIDTVKFLKTKSTLPNKQLAEEFQRKSEFDLAAFLLACKKVFNSVKTTFYKRTLIYITNDDEPVQDASKKFTALNEIKTFNKNENQISFQVVPTTENFNYSKFYNELFSVLDNPPLEEICEDQEGLIEKLTLAVVMRHTRRKIVFYPFKHDPTHFVNCYKLDFIRASTLNNSKLTKDGKSVKSITEDVEASYYFKGGNQVQDSIKFDSYEKCCVLDSNLSLGLNVLYVSKRSTNVGYILGKPFLLQSIEENEGFLKFWRFCVEKKRVLVCALKQNQPGKIRYTELIPVTINGSVMFLVKYIPFATEISLPKEVDYPAFEPNEKKKEAIRNIVNSLTFDFDMQIIPDPCYRNKREYVKAKLLDEPKEEVNMEKINPDIRNVEILDKQLKEAVDIINKNFVLVEDRKRKGVTGASKTKKSK